ncbi:MAG: GTP-binding protein [Faecousia sp.]
MSKVILVGGFLGAGKTSLLWRAAEIIKKKGNKVGLITNDQATNLVDTTFLTADENIVREVSGSCFCCNFPGFADAIAYVIDKTHGGTVIAEPVGSCTDLSATLMQPLKDKYADTVDLAPLTVMADPERLAEVLKDVAAFGAYIASKQFEEADIILINKSDLLTAEAMAELAAKAGAQWPRAKIMTASVKDNVGVEEWLNTVLAAEGAGTHLAEVDYDIYAAGEAAYGWLNATFNLGKPGDYPAAAKALIEALGKAFDARNATVGHVKFLLQTADHQWIGNLTCKAHTASLRNHTRSATAVTLTINARVEMKPEELQMVVLNAVQTAFAGFDCTQTGLNCLIPGRPNPTYHYSEVI